MTSQTTTMKRSWLVQRLAKPHNPSGQFDGLLSSMAFGGGLRNGGLSPEAMDVLRPIFRFDYMGAAEFEFGAVPKALQAIAASKNLRAFSFDVDLATVAKDFREKGAAPTGSATVYALCPKGMSAEVEARVRAWASEGYRSELKETTRLSSTLRPATEWDGEAVGWLELDNGFMFFTDREMWVQTAAVFGVEAS